MTTTQQPRTFAEVPTEDLIYSLIDARRRFNNTPKGFVRGVWSAKSRNIAAELRTRRNQEGI